MLHCGHSHYHFAPQSQVCNKNNVNGIGITGILPRPILSQQAHQHPSVHQHQVVQAHHQQQSINSQLSIQQSRHTPRQQTSQISAITNSLNATLDCNEGAKEAEAAATPQTKAKTSVDLAYGDKSPMCLINELVRFNGISHQYRLIDETGPPHDKTFTVVLKLDDKEEYEATGPSIRKAQHAAAANALEETHFRHPTPKPNKKSQSTWPLTPTVELNVLAMKRGEPAIYHVIEMPRQPNTYFAASTYDYRGMYNQRYHVPRGPYCARLSVGSRQFIGKGKTAQAARHAAAEEALKVLRGLPLPEKKTTSVQVLVPEGLKENTITKSPISMVHEMALKRALHVRFEVVDESGPSHMPVFITRCIVGDIVTTGEGNGKKISKKNAAEKMLEELNKLPFVIPTSIEQNEEQARQRIKVQRRKQTTFEKKRRSGNLVKERPKKEIAENESGENVTQNSDEANLSLTIHPINRLIQLQQALKEKEPLFRVLNEKLVDKRKKEFVMECAITTSKSSTCPGPSIVTATGTGPNKKIAKKNAAEAMLHQLGYSSKPPQMGQQTPASILKQDSTESSSSIQQQKIRKVKFIEGANVVVNNDQLVSTQTTNVDQQTITQQSQPTLQPKSGRQLVPGLLLIQSENFNDP